MLERRKLKFILKNSSGDDSTTESLLNGWKNNKKLLFLIGLIFTFVPLLLFIGLELAGAINGSIALKSEIIFSILFGYLILKEKITKIQVIFSIVLFFGLFLAVTQGSFHGLEFNLGVLIIIFDVGLYMLGHSFSKKLYDRKELTPNQFVLFRTLIGGTILASTYFIFYPLKNLSLLLDPLNQLYFLLIGFVYGFGLLTWSKTLSYIKMGKTIILISFSTFITAFFATLLLGEIFTIYHFIGILIVIISIVMIIKEKDE